MGLHEAWVNDAVVGCWGANAAIGFLHYDSEDEASVNASGFGNGLN